MSRVKHCRPLQDTELVLAWISETVWRAACVSAGLRHRSRDSNTTRGSKMQRYQTHAPLPPLFFFAEPPAWAYRKRANSHSTHCHSASPEGSSWRAQEFGTELQLGLQPGAERPPSFVLALILSLTGIPVFHVWLRCQPRSVFRYWFCWRAGVSWAVTSEFDGKWIVNSDHDEGKNLNSGWLGPKNIQDKESLCY